jgi:hypothetical protein
VKADQLHDLDPELVYNPNKEKEFKTKPIFKITKSSSRSRKNSMSNDTSESCFLTEITRQSD